MKRQFVFLLAVFVFFPMAALSQKPSDQTFRVLEVRISHAVVEKDASTMDKLFASDYVSVGVSGHVRSRSEIIEAYSHGAITISTSHPENMTVRQYGDFAIVIGLVTIAGVEGTTDISGRYTFTRIYKQESGRWCAVSFQVTPLK